MKKLTLCLAVSLALTGLSACQTQSSPEAMASNVSAAVKQDQNQAFSSFSQSFIDSLWQVAPTWALYNGFHQYDAKLLVPDATSRTTTLNFIQQQRAKMASFDFAALTAANLIDYRLIENVLGSMEWEIKRFKSWQWDPSSYNVAGGFAQIINEDFAPLEQRLRSVLGRLENVPAYYRAAQQNIDNPTLEHTELAIMQNQGAFSVLSDELLAKVNASGLNADEKALFKQRMDKAVAAIEGHIQFLKQLEQQLKQEGSRSFRIGEVLYEEKFAFDIQAGMSAKVLYEKALADKARVQGEMAKITDKLWGKYFQEPKPQDEKKAIRQLIDKLSARHVKREDFVDEVRAQIPELVKFVNQHELVTLDPKKPLVVRETPEYMRGFAGASISAPGPYEKGGNTYYNVTPLDGMTDEQAESYLREYNHWILQVLNIHEAIPGHYTQLVYSNESPSLVKSLFGNGAMVEGWAVYAERMMLEQGYGNFEPEMWLMYYKWNLRVICNTILDYSIQVKGMTEEQAIKLMTDEAFQQQAEAEGKWRRATLSQVQLTSYYAGYREIYDLREELKQQQGKAFDLKTFHENFLSYGSAPVKYISQLMQDK
ncbi:MULTISPECIES: DUF885 domain-containing protein [Shewanella]|jgi:uncharacterized protein (DUF885 family)|uniref:DUF885 family protein n=1 Tax=Shewanella chilikensis TaxID=558541 RepID=A0A6G7LSL0_9GAMM|nr:MULTISPECIES: DUF885 domain-containing protein [Shewanella]MBZ4678975.1 hypothetical protein [Shewanella sp.]MCA0949499.1 DUF885 domain-containing protein [Shewanella chilikensis]MCE9853672.1 DUF885 domain-containing protein [Shewanella chilikensis]MCL1164058.1 DUF885 domain-containing protein [Shewanella chilikensis]QIJ04759.1 DUF885 family protein [Shewanella chilikensis]